MGKLARRIRIKHYQVPGLVILAVMTGFRAYQIMDSLRREFSAYMTWIDLSIIFIWGLISGMPICVAGSRRFKLNQ